jgi:NAD(P)-dependent dehydrogenase (short-subunit alcohol dehydrogenase family)
VSTQGSGGLAGKVVLITGAARGIGAEVARRLARQGAKLALVGLEGDQLAEVARQCGPDAHSWEADVTDRDALDRVVTGVVDRFGGVDVVVANAGIAATGFVRSIDPAAFERVIEVNLLGVWRTVRACLPQIVARRGYVLLVSSLAAVVHIPGNAAYSAAKAGVEAFGNSLRAEVRHLGVDVGVAHFSWISTDMVNSADQHPVFGPLRTGTPGLLSKTYPVSAVGKAMVAGIAKRARVVHVPGWIGPLKAVRSLIPRIVEAQSAKMIPAADRAVEQDIAQRGAEASSRPVGPGGEAAVRKR